MMVQIESCSTHQLWTDRPVMFLLPLLVLLMAIQVIFACECEEPVWLRAMCPEENKTVIMGAVLRTSNAGSTSHSGIQVLHDVKLDKIFKEGHTNLTWFPQDTIRMLSPEDCSLDDTGEEIYYTIIGVTEVGGILHSRKCTTEAFDGFF